MRTGARLAAELRRAWNGSPWHGPSVRDVLGRLTAADAATRSVRGSNTPWQLVLHLTTWVEVALCRIDDPAYDPLESMNFPEPRARDAGQWTRDVDALGSTIERLAQRVATMSDAELDAPVGARGYTYTTMLDGEAQHLAYHAGQAAMLARSRDVAPLLAPAPVFPLSAVVLAELVHRYLYAAAFFPPPIVGWTLLASGGGLAAWAYGHFVRRRTPAVPWVTPRNIVSAGPYRFSRNPMYLGFLLAQAGVGCLRHNALYLVLLLPTWAFIHWGVVRREEPFLLRKFGQPYRQLLDTTRRWL